MQAKRSSSPIVPVGIGRPLRRRCGAIELRRRRALEVHVQLGLGDHAQRPRGTGSGTLGRGGVADRCIAARRRRDRARRRARRSSRGVDDARAAARPGRPPRRGRRRPSSPTAWSTASVLARAAAAERRARRRRPRARRPLRRVPALRRATTSTVTGARGQVAVRALEQVRPGRPARRPSRAKRSAAAPARSASSAAARAALVGVEAAEPQQLRAQRERDLEQPRLGVAAAGEQRRSTRAPRPRCPRCGRAPGPCRSAAPRRPARCPRATSTIALRQLARASRVGHERARADLHVHDQRVEPGGELLGQDRGDDQRDRLDRRGRVAQRVQAPVGGRELRGLADDRAARLARPRRAARRGRASCRSRGSSRACRASRRCGRGRGRRSSAPPPPQAATIGASSSDDLVADAAGRVLVERRARSSSHSSTVPRARHRAGQRDPLGARQVAQEDRHRQRADLAVGQRAVGDPATRNSISSSVSSPPSRLRRISSGGITARARRSRSMSGPQGAAPAARAVAQRLLVAERLVAHALGEVRDRRHRGDAQAAVARDDRLGHGRHADERRRRACGTRGSRRASRSSARRPRGRRPRAARADRLGRRSQPRAQLGVVGVAQAREARADRVVVGAGRG